MAWQEEQQREAEEIARMVAEEQLQHERVQVEEARRGMEEGCRHLLIAALSQGFWICVGSKPGENF